MFKLDDKQIEALNKWLDNQRRVALSMQRASITEDSSFYQTYKSSWDTGYPYTGAIGGGITYSFTPTSLGLVTKVTYGLTNETIDLTDYDSW